MKGVLFTLTVFLILFGLLVYLSQTTKQTNAESMEKIAGQRLFHLWHSIADDISDSLNLTVKKVNDTIQINDSMPAEQDVQKFLDDYARFVEQKFKEGNFDAAFEDEAGNKVDLSTMQSKFTIKPLQIAYIWPTLKKDNMKIQVDKKNFSYIEEINLTIFVSPQINNTANIKWDPLKKCKGGTKYCLKLNLIVTDGSATWTSSETEFDVDHQSELKNLHLGPTGGADQRVEIKVGDLKDLIKVDPKNANVSTSLTLKLNTSSFFLNYPARLNVTTAFGKKIDWL